MKTIRLIYPDYVSGAQDIYYLGAKLLTQILPENPAQPKAYVDIPAPDGKEKTITEGIYGKEAVLVGIDDAMQKLKAENPDKVITVGGNCLVSLAPFDYLHGKYENLGIVWIDAHPDISTPADGYPNAHAMVLGALLGHGDYALSQHLQNAKFKPEQVLYVGLQEPLDFQKRLLKELGLAYKIQDKGFLSLAEIQAFASQFEHVLVHFDVDVLDEHYFHDTYFANPDAGGDGSGGGKMRMEELAEILKTLEEATDIVGFSIAEYMPFSAYALHRMFAKLKLFNA